MKIKITESDLHGIIRQTVETILEKREYSLRGELICRLPYFVTLLFTNHCIEREYERDITEKDIIKDAEAVIKDVIRDFESGQLKSDEYIKIINRENCVVSICSLITGRGNSKTGRMIQHLVAVTTYIWDGRINIDQGNHNYYIGEPSEEYLEAKKWNAENQDKVLAYMDWKRNNDIKRQMRKADNEHYYRNNSEISPEKRMDFINRTYDNQARLDKKAIHNAMDPDEFKAIQDYYKEVDSRPLSSKFSANRDLRAMDLLKKRREMSESQLKELVMEAVRRVLSEMDDSTNLNMLAARTAGNDEFYTKMEDVEKELPNYAQFFRGKKIYCPCDGPQSKIFQWFKNNFRTLGLQSLDATSFSFTGNGQYIQIDASGNMRSGMLRGDGDFRSEESQMLMSRCDIVVTNPPFTLFSDIVSQCQRYGKKFLLLGNKNAASTKTVFNLMRTGEVTYGYSKPGEFVQPEGDKIKRMSGLTRWFTNLPVNTEKKFAPTAQYDPQRHLRPDNETDDIINVDSIKDIPYDYDGKMLVPITIFDQGLDRNEYDIIKMVRPVVGGKRKFVRVLIQKRK